MTTTQKNECKTYFRIVGNFDPKAVCDRLGLTPDRIRNIGDPLPNGRIADSAFCNFGTVEEYDVYTDRQMEKTIALLQGKEEILNAIRQEYDVEFFIVTVAKITADESTPTLAPSLTVMDFCHAVRAQIDVDLYVI